MKVLKSRPLKWLISLWDAIAGDFYRHDGLLHSASIAFFMVFCSAPLLMLMIALLGFSTHFVEGSYPHLLSQLLGYLELLGKELFPLRGDLQADIQTLVEQREELGLIGMIVLVLAASQLFRAIEVSLDVVFRDLPLKHPKKPPKGLRGFLISKAVFPVFIISIAAFLIIAYLILHIFFQELSKVLPVLGAFFGNPETGGTWASIITSSIITSLLYMLILGATVRHQVKWVFSLIGGFLFYLLIYTMGRIYSIYVGLYLKYFGEFYGSFTRFYLLIFWIFCLSVVFLLCAEVVKAMEERWRIRRVHS